MNTSSLFSRSILAIAAGALLTLACGCQCNNPPPSKPAPDGKDRPVKATMSGPHHPSGK